MRDNQAKLTSGALSTAATVTEIVTGALLVLFTLIFFLHGGRNIWAFVTRIFPARCANRVADAGVAGFHSLIGYVRATFLVALVDAVGIGAGLAIMGVPLALPLASLVFLGAFIPLVGAVLTGFLAVVVALLTKGFFYALITLGLIIAVQQVEAHVLQPLVMGRAVSIHPLAVVLGIAGGGVLAGIVGALLAVPDDRLPQQRGARAGGRRPGRRGSASGGTAGGRRESRHRGRGRHGPRVGDPRSGSRARAGPRGAGDPARSHRRRGGADCRRSPHRAYLRRAR